MAAIVPDFDSGIGALWLVLAMRGIDDLRILGIAAIFALAREYHTTPGVINNLTSK